MCCIQQAECKGLVPGNMKNSNKIPLHWFCFGVQSMQARPKPLISIKENKGKLQFREEIAWCHSSAVS